MFKPFNISVVNRNRRDNGDFVRLEQEPWDINTGYITKFAMFQYINHLLFNADPPEANCPTLLPRTVYAYPSRPDLNYRIGCTWGTLGPRRINESDFQEAIQCNLQLQLETEYPPLEINGYTWLGAAYSPEGDFLSHPAVTIVDGKIRIAQAVYGTLLVSYKVHRHLYTLALPVRPGAAENTVQSHLYARWSGGNEVIEIKQPEGAETGECNYITGYTLDISPDDQPPDHVDPEDEYVDIDFCTGLEVVE
ncbi:hypothetical protein JT06_15850 [Desulfobulbus sp. Tol-SR]|nr:hypothetical protein JT06_15850 [Desulfobulbus sp. Tol-SR]